MKYEEFRKSLNELKRNALDLAFTNAGKIDEDKFASCYEIANELTHLNESNIGEFIKYLDIVPCTYSRASFLIARELNEQCGNLISDVKYELNKIYVKEFNKAIEKKVQKFAVFDSTYVQDCLDLKTRFIDEVEIIAISKQVDVKPDDVIGDYKGEDLKTKTLSLALKRIRKNSVAKEYKDKIDVIINKSLCYAKANIKALNKSKKV